MENTQRAALRLLADSFSRGNSMFFTILITVAFLGAAAIVVEASRRLQGLEAWPRSRFKCSSNSNAAASGSVDTRWCVRGIEPRTDLETYWFIEGRSYEEARREAVRRGIVVQPADSSALVDVTPSQQQASPNAAALVAPYAGDDASASSSR